MIFPLLVLLMFGGIEGGRFVVSRVMLSYAVVVGVRAATLSGASTSSVQTAVVAAAPMLHLAPSQVEVAVSGGGTLPATVGNTVTVSVGVVNPANKYNFRSLIPTKFTARSWSARSTMVVR